MQALPAALAPLAAYAQFIHVRLVPDPGKPGKTIKLPIDWRTGEVADAHNPAIWMAAPHALAQLPAWGPGYCLGWVLTRAAGVWCLDVDSCITPAGQWTATATKLMAQLHGAAVELSQSGKGLHIWGMGAVPLHSSKCADEKIELYSERRFIALTGNILGGDCFTDHTPALAVLVANCFPPRAAVEAGKWDNGPCPEWQGPEDDDELIRRACLPRKPAAAAVFGGASTHRASFADLWSAKADALGLAYPDSGRGYDASSADAALAQHLAFWTGKDAARIERLMRRSALVRDKWDNHLTYLRHFTIDGACGRQTQVLQDKRPEPAAGEAPHAEPIMAGAPYSAARSILKRRYWHADARTLNAWQGQFYEWDAGGWRERAQDDMRAMVYELLDRDALGTCHPTRERVSGILDALKAAAHVDSLARPPCWMSDPPGPAPQEILPCRNGLLHLPTRDLLPATPRFFSTVATSCDYWPDAPPPMHWLAFLRELWPQDQESIDALQEVFGYLLTPDTTQQKLFLIVGPKRSGKGTIGRVLSRLLGEANVASPSLGSLGGEFGLQPLFGKLAAIVSDARLGGRADAKAIAENLLRISGEDPVTVNRKFLAPITMQLSVRFVMLTNELPRLADASGAMASRFVVLHMDRSFYGKEDPGLTARLLSELPGVLNWAVAGWQRLRQRGHFVTPRSAQDQVQELADLGSPITAFVRDACALVPTASVSADALFQAWRLWCRDAGRQHEGDKAGFGRDLRAAVGGLKRTQPRDNGDRVPTYQGIGLLPAWQTQVNPFVARAGTGGTGQ